KRETDEIRYLETGFVEDLQRTPGSRPFFRALHDSTPMNILITAGNTQVPIDRVRAITNVFTGRTGARIALRAHERGHCVTLLTSHPESIVDPSGDQSLPSERWIVGTYQTFDDLEKLMGVEIRDRGYDAVIHSAAVSDFRAAGVYAPGA